MTSWMALSRRTANALLGSDLRHGVLRGEEVFFEPRERTRLYLYHLTPATPPNHLIPAIPPTRRPFAEALPVPRSKSGEVIRVAFGDENGFVYADVGV